ncbi:type I restriction enzyme, R subunit [Spirosomataceae bacterium TFI 002]|nr:type I restriction enzyme, R subunit [Spirosomataceae bacterium TFI 002]
MNRPSFREDHISQIPAIQLLMKLGYVYLTPSEANHLRGAKVSNVILEEVLRDQLKLINSDKKISSTRTTYVSDSNIEHGIRFLKEITTNDGYIAACEKAYNLLTLGQTLDQTFDGELKSITLNYIDWQDISNNKFHVTEEFRVMKSSSKEYFIPDIVLFVNGIPFAVIECKRPDIKEPIAQAINQTLKYQQSDGIRPLYLYNQLQLCLADSQAAYGSNNTKPEFFAKWKEYFPSQSDENKYHENLKAIKNRKLDQNDHAKLFSETFFYLRGFFEQQGEEELETTTQDEYIYNLCRPERLMDLSHNFILFENGTKKIARYQQFFAVKKAIERIHIIDHDRRQGGVVWHTQGSGKSLTMVMLAQAIAMDRTLSNPKIILVTDRTDLDDQISNTFRKCGKFVNRATTGKRLVDLLESDSDAVVTTIINKFVAAVKKIETPLTSKNIFVLVDEGHRTQHGTFNVDMQRTLPNACFIAFTGTPLFLKDKNTAQKFGGIIEPSYTVDQAVKDGAVVPLLYEGRIAIQNVNPGPIDTFFSMVSEPLGEYETADLKKKYAQKDHLNAADQKMWLIAHDISKHYRDNWQGTGFKAQLVCDKKASAVKYKTLLDTIGMVSSEVLISQENELEGDELSYDQPSEQVKRFYTKMVDDHGNAKTYEKNIISRFKHQQDPEIIIVVDKLLTGFDEPKNTVLYLTRNLKGHKLLQAIARVNRVAPDKEFGYIIDYYGVIENLDEALDLYSSFSDFDLSDLEGTMLNVTEEVKKLSQHHSELWSIFKGLKNKLDPEPYQKVLRDEAVRVGFYDKLAKYAKTLKLALSTINFRKSTNDSQIENYQEDLKFFIKLRIAAIQRYSDKVDYKKYEGQIQKLIDTHVTSEKIEVITDLVNIFDRDKFQEEIEKTVGLAAKADKIASRTAKHISERMEEDPAFYKKFSQLLQEAIAAYEAHRLSEAQYLKKVKEILENVRSGTDQDIPAQFATFPVARATYGLTLEFLKQREIIDATIASAIATGLLTILDIAILDKGVPKVDWKRNTQITGKLLIDLGDYLIDEVRDKHQVELSFKEMDDFAENLIEMVAKHYT